MRCQIWMLNDTSALKKPLTLKIILNQCTSDNQGLKRLLNLHGRIPLVDRAIQICLKRINSM